MKVNRKNNMKGLPHAYTIMFRCLLKSPILFYIICNIRMDWSQRTLRLRFIGPLRFDARICVFIMGRGGRWGHGHWGRGREAQSAPGIGLIQGQAEGGYPPSI